MTGGRFRKELRDESLAVGRLDSRYTRDNVDDLDVAPGYYDFATPSFDAEYTLNRHSIGAERVVYKYYGGGHMMYLNEPSRTQLLDDVREFVQAQSGSE